MRSGERRVTSLALLPHLRRCAEIVDAVAGGAVRRSGFGSRHDGLSMLALEELFARGVVAPAAQRRNFIRRGDAVRRDRSGGSAVLDTGAMTCVAAQSLLEMLMGLEVGNLFGV